jgi:uncharacterized protein (DUF1015 family)
MRAFHELRRRGVAAEDSVPEVRPFRALRFGEALADDLARVVAPPYDVIGPDQHETLLARHPSNVVRLDLPRVEAGDEEDDRYRRAARTLAAWRSDGTLHKDPHPSIYVYEQTYCVPGTTTERTQRGFFARLRLEELGRGSGVLPHERTMAAPKEDRYKLLRATGVNTSPVIGLYRDPGADVAGIIERLTAARPGIDVVDDDGTKHRLWAVPADGAVPDRSVAALLAAAGSGPITIADGHHRYETALRYRDERRMTRSCDEDPAFDYLLALLVDAAEPLTVLPTHRVVGGLADGGAGLIEAARDLFDVRPGVAVGELAAASSSAGLAAGGSGRFGLWTRSGGAWLQARRHAFERHLPPGGDALRRLDVTLLGAALEQLAGIDAAAAAAGRIAFTKSAAEAIAWVDEGRDGADAAFLLDPTPVADIVAVARDGDVMPQKSTYFFPKALTGLVINPHEW